MTQEEMQTIIKRANENSTRQYELGYEKAKEQMIEKACEWLREYTDDYFVRDTDDCWLREDDFIRDFKNYMEE